MLDQLKAKLKHLWRAVRPLVLRALVATRNGMGALWSALRPPLVFVLQVIAALIVLFEEWGWRPLSDALGRLARYRPWAMLELWIAGLPPYGALVAFAIPTTVLLPLKFVALWLLAGGYVWSSGALFVGAKLASTALVARIFTLTKPALMRIGWFARAYDVFLPWKETFFSWIRESYVWRYGRLVKARVKSRARQAWARWKPAVLRAWLRWWPRFTEVLTRFRGRFRRGLTRILSRLRLEGARLSSWLRLRRDRRL